jgi:hypothetical protein
MQGKRNSQIESHLIANAVSNAVARRNQALGEESLTALSDDEAGAIRGGIASVTNPTTTTVKYPVVVTAGIIALPAEVM